MKNTVPGEPIQHKYPSMCMADIIMRPITEDGILDLAGDGAIPIIGVVIIHTTDTDGATPTHIHITDMEVIMDTDTQGMGAIMVTLIIEGEVITAIPWLEHIIEDEVTTITAVVEELITIEEEITALKITIIQELNLVEDHNQILET